MTRSFDRVLQKACYGSPYRTSFYFKTCSYLWCLLARNRPISMYWNSNPASRLRQIKQKTSHYFISLICFFFSQGWKPSQNFNLSKLGNLNHFLAFFKRRMRPSWLLRKERECTKQTNWNRKLNDAQSDSIMRVLWHCYMRMKNGMRKQERKPDIKSQQLI